ncbi:hypothetical protein B0H14DRAFT_2671451 [Mycena olivaceomarginata]|nr:hypothetical protein B0H14DRAFT_2671451 [Mycena olivaceomarginata]
MTSYNAAVVCASAYCSEWATAVRYLAGRPARPPSEKAACAASRVAPVPSRAPRSGYSRECRERAAPHGAGALPRRNCADGCDTLRTHPTCRLDTCGTDIRARLAVSRARLTDAHPSRRCPRWARSSTVASAGLYDLPTQYLWATLGLTTSPTLVASYPTSRS